MKRLKVETVVLISNYFNHHQRPLSDALFKIYGDGYKFIETAVMTQERKNMGWGEENYPEYVVSCDNFEKQKQEYINIINDADVVVIGSASNEYIQHRIKNKKLVFRYTERPLKNNKDSWKNIVRAITWRKFNPQNGKMQLLCSSAFAYADYLKLGMYKNKAYKFGYFTEVKKYDDVDKLVSEKHENSILWCARLIPLKHPETTVEIAKRLKNDGYNFKLDVIGSGEMETQLKNEILREGLENYVNMLGSMKPSQVREKMDESEIFFFTSDRNEGWGAVVNESMNSACAVVASSAIGAVPFLISHEENGLIYKDGDIDDLYLKIKGLLDNSEKRKTLVKKAYFTITEEWNAENAARKFSKLAEGVVNGDKTINLFSSGVCSKSKVLKEGWFER